MKDEQMTTEQRNDLVAFTLRGLTSLYPKPNTYATEAISTGQ